jgi:hypothetical protein
MLTKTTVTTTVTAGTVGCHHLPTISITPTIIEWKATKQNMYLVSHLLLRRLPMLISLQEHDLVIKIIAQGMRMDLQATSVRPLHHHDDLQQRTLQPTKLRGTKMKLYRLCGTIVGCIPANYV